jgi:rubrerythrin
VAEPGVGVLGLGTGTVGFDPIVEARHHHLVCRRCGKVRDRRADFAGLEVGAGEGQGFDVSSAEVVVRDRCGDCRTGVVPGPRAAGPGYRDDAHGTRRKVTEDMATLKGSKTENNLKQAFAAESQANRRYLYFAQKADVEGYPDIAALFRSVAEGETGHAFGHFDFLREVGDPVTGEPVGSTEDNLKSAIDGETYEYPEMYPGFAKTAREEGLDEIAEWLETLARAEKSHAGRFTKGLESIT